MATAGGGGVSGRAHFVLALVFVFGFALKDSAEVGDYWRHCLFFLFFLVGDVGKGGFFLLSTAYFGWDGKWLCGPDVGPLGR